MSKFLCNKCGYVHISEEMPEICGVCGATSEFYTNVDHSKEQFIPDYWAEHITQKVQKIRENQIKAGRRGFSFGLISDIHWIPNAKHSAAILERVMNECDVPYFFNAGDTVAGVGNCKPDFIIKDLLEYKEAFRKIESRALVAQGNHDPTYSDFPAPLYYKQNLNHSEIYEYIYRYNSKYPDRTISDDGTYYYADSKALKARFVVLNPYDVPSDETDEQGWAVYNKMSLNGYRQAQLEWFANAALDVPSSDWTVVLCTHTNPASEEPCYNEEIIFGLINAFRKGTAYSAQTTPDFPEYNAKIECDFTGRGGQFAVWVSGHMHRDIVTERSDILCLSIISDWNHNHERLPFKRPGGTVMEHAFDIYTVSPDEHKIYITRVGAGEDRVFDYK